MAVVSMYSRTERISTDFLSLLHFVVNANESYWTAWGEVIAQEGAF